MSMTRLNDATLHQLNIFRSVVENSGFAAAQANLNTSSSTISTKMKELEACLGITLCQRGRMGFKLTERGEAVYDATNSLFAAVENFKLSIAHIHQDLTGEVRIGLQDNLASSPNFHLSDALARFHQRANNVTFRLEDAMAGEQEARTLDGKYHLSIGVFPHRLPGLTYQTLFRDEICLYAAASHPLLKNTNSKITLSDIYKYEYVSAGLIEGAVPLIKKLSLKCSAFAENMDAAVMLLLSNHYIGFLPTHFAKTWIDKGVLKPLLPKQTLSNVQFHLIARRGVHQPYVVKMFISDILQCHDVKT